eukprot:CAMPEP_0169436180 /NCGR_PEP_ID=MMETSP1042-20121227/5454_1 /TAXON_ID=464988 /ORGANISM="Hemiselmis andersenii, Strain CCMP1180" /LENGTH=79 /DNA_ID=CAMNT_0009546863 /DNA_START=745 /DNA_END=984 /DNA_ORIENTATION=-
MVDTCTSSALPLISSSLGSTYGSFPSKRSSSSFRDASSSAALPVRAENDVNSISFLGFPAFEMLALLADMFARTFLRLL